MEIAADDKNDSISIQTYQSLERQMPDTAADSLSDYQYIVCDEFHYFLDDSLFNNRTDISLDRIMNAEHAVKIFMSATGDDISAYIRLEYDVVFKEYVEPPDYSGIERLVFYHNEAVEEAELRRIIQNGEKAIVFVQKAERAYELYQKFCGDALFCCSKSNTDYYKHVDSGKIEKMLSEEKFEESVLVTTSCLDAGVNIIDRKVKHIFVDLQDVDSVKQCIGRKRRQDTADKVIVHIKAISNSSLKWMITKAKKQLEKPDYLLKYGYAKFYEKYFREQDESGILYDKILPDGRGSTKEVNRLMYTKKKNCIQELQQMLALGEYGYCKYLAKEFERYDRETDFYDYDVQHEPGNPREEYLREHVGMVMLEKDDRKELINVMAVRRNGKLKKSSLALNDELENLKLPYEIIKYPTSRMIDGEKKNYNAAWKLVKTELPKKKAA